jgi:8-oxo-dGTP pyrophosphatase MutT (NUDIX family)
VIRVGGLSLRVPSGWTLGGQVHIDEVNEVSAGPGRVFNWGLPKTGPGKDVTLNANNTSPFFSETMSTASTGAERIVWGLSAKGNLYSGSITVPINDAGTLQGRIPWPEGTGAWARSQWAGPSGPPGGHHAGPLLAQPPRRVYDHIRTRVIVVTDGAMLLVPPAGEQGTWGSPGGGLEPGETLAQCAQREVWEETGIEVRVERIAFVQEWVSTPGRAEGRDYDLHLFLRAVPVGPTTPRAEAPGLPVPQWVPLERIPAMPVHPAELKWFALALSRGEEPEAGGWARGRFEDPMTEPRPVERG